MSMADYALAPAQDVLGCGPKGRMNRPGTASGNWGWRFAAERLSPGIVEWLGELTATYGRERERLA